MSAGLPVPQRVFGHGFLLNKGEKMSKSLGNVVSERWARLPRSLARSALRRLTIASCE
jgi:methionyl-tRNA synthetase